ncbi:MAG TPA: hypothetical protein VFV08_05150 [Puia sp.]|nr:hypothetical protein [Puia sp.]
MFKITCTVCFYLINKEYRNNPGKWDINAAQAPIREVRIKEVDSRDINSVTLLWETIAWKEEELHNIRITDLNAEKYEA